MSKRILFVIILFASTSCIYAYEPWESDEAGVYGATPFIEPAGDLRYDQVTWLMSHNAFVSKKYGYKQYQQRKTIKEQLQLGVRGLMLDSFYSPTVFYRKKVIFCHGNCNQTRGILRPFKKDMKIKDQLKKIKDFLNENPKAIVTIVFENKIKSKNKKKLGKELRDVFGGMLLVPAEWDPYAHDGMWPTVGWLRQNNKRVIVFSDKSVTKEMYPQWKYMVENMYGTMTDEKEDFETTREERDDSEKQERYPRRLYLMNYFPTFRISDREFENKNGKQLRDVVDYVVKRGLHGGKYAGRYPNFLAIDHVHKGNPVAIVNEMNAKAQDAEAREQMYSVLRGPKTLTVEQTKNRAGRTIGAVKRKR